MNKIKKKVKIYSKKVINALSVLLGKKNILKIQSIEESLLYKLKSQNNYDSIVIKATYKQGIMGNHIIIIPSNLIKIILELFLNYKIEIDLNKLSDLVKEGLLTIAHTIIDSWNNNITDGLNEKIEYDINLQFVSNYADLWDIFIRNPENIVIEYKFKIKNYCDDKIIIITPKKELEEIRKSE